MTVPDYTAISQVETDSGKPLRAELIKRMSFNPLAIAGGADDAPRIRAEAQGGSVAGDTLLFSVLGGTRSYTVLGIVPGGIFRAIAACEVRVNGQVQRTTGIGSDAAKLDVFKNGTSVVSAFDESGTLTSITATDITLEPGDVLWFRLTVTTSDGPTTGLVQNLTVSTGAIRTVGGI